MKSNFKETGGGPPIDIKLTWYEEILYSELQLGIVGLPSCGDSDEVEEAGSHLHSNHLYGTVLPFSLPLCEINNEQLLFEKNNVDQPCEDQLEPENRIDIGKDQENNVDLPAVAGPSSSVTKKWNLKRRRAPTDQQKKNNIEAFETLAEHKKQLVDVQQKCYEVELIIKQKEEARLEEEHKLKKQLLEEDLNIKREQLRALIDDRKRQESINILTEEKKN